MKIISFVLPCLLVLAGCSTPSQPEAPKPPQIGMANPASVYCQQKGGTLIPVQTTQGVSNNCKLPGGETIDEWALWRRDHISFVLPCLLVLAGCSTPSQPEAPKPPQIGMANPASVYCQQKGGTLIPVQTAQGVSNNCKLPGGETIDEWALWRRDHPAGEK